MDIEGIQFVSNNKISIGSNMVTKILVLNNKIDWEGNFQIAHDATGVAHDINGFEFLCNGIAWEMFLWAIYEAEGLGVCVLFDMLLAEDNAFYHSLRGIHY